jgi:tetratricopeptide (TPR) repeat protein
MTGLPSVLSRVYLSWSLGELGAFAEGIARGEEGVQIAGAADHPFSLIWAYVGIGHLYLGKGDFHRSIPVLERGLGLCQDWGIPALFSTVASILGAAYAVSGRVPEALQLLEQAASTGSRSHRFARLSEAYLLAGRVEDALESARRALDLSRDYKQRGYHANALRLVGEIAAGRDSPERDRAQPHYRQALAVADELGMRPLAAHCHLGLGKLYRRTSDDVKAREHLATAATMYREMGMHFWLEQVEVALKEVGQ